MKAAIQRTIRRRTPEVDDDAYAARLRRLDGFFDAIQQIRSAGTDIAAEDIAPVAFVMNSKGERLRLVGQVAWRSEDLHDSSQLAHASQTRRPT